MDKIRWGIIGCGNVTEVKSGPGFQRAEHSELVAVMRRNGELAEDYAKRHGVPRWYDNAEALIADPEVDAVYVATPPDGHLPYAVMAAKAGKPVYVEKPMALNYEECESMLDACSRAEVPLFVAYYRRALPRFVHVKRLIDQGAVGRVRHVHTVQTKPLTEQAGGAVPWRLEPSVSGGGYFFDLASHTLDVLDYLLGPIRSAAGHAANLGGAYAAEDTVSAVYEFEAGVQGTGTWCFCGFEHVDRNEIVGDRGRLEFSTFGHEPVVLTTAEGVTTYPFEAPKHIQQPLIQTIVNDLLGKGVCESTGQTAARTSRVMDQIVANRR